MLSESERAAWIAEYYYNGGASAFELAMVDFINHERERRGLSTVTVDASLMHAARFYAQTIANLELPLRSSVGPYGGSLNTANAFGGNLGRWQGGSSNRGGWSYRAMVGLWLSSPNSNFILAADQRYIGFGSHFCERYGVIHYLFMSSRPSA